jgi:hypothetical protein
MRGVEVLTALLFVIAACGSDDTEVSSDRNARRSEPNAQPSGATAVWSVDRSDPPTEDSESFTALVTRLECSGGETGEVLEPTVSPEDDRIVVTFAVEPLPPGDYTCPGNDERPYIVELGEPVGDRELADGACLSGDAVPTSFCVDGPVRWSPRPAP